MRSQDPEPTTCPKERRMGPRLGLPRDLGLEEKPIFQGLDNIPTIKDHILPVLNTGLENRLKMATPASTSRDQATTIPILSFEEEREARQLVKDSGISSPTT